MGPYQNPDIKQQTIDLIEALSGGTVDSYSIDNQILFLTDADCPGLVPYDIFNAIFLSIVNTGATKIITSAGEIPAGNTDVFTFPNAQNIKQNQWAIIIPVGGSCTVITQTKVLL